MGRQRTARLAAFAGVAVMLAACAGRTANPVTTVQAYDATLSCPQISAEIAGNDDKAKQLMAEKHSAHNRNVAIGVVGGLLFWPALFALDLSDAEKVEMEALRTRDGYLANMMAQRGCGDPAAVPPQQVMVRATEQVTTTRTVTASQPVSPGYATVAPPVEPAAPPREAAFQVPVAPSAPAAVAVPFVPVSTPAVATTPGDQEFTVHLDDGSGAAGASSVAPAPATVASADACAPYRASPVDRLRCQWATGPQRDWYVPGVGRSASLRTQMACIPDKDDPDRYAACVARGS
jgi:hypothetical protein